MDMYQDVTSETDYKILKLIVSGIKYYKPCYIQTQVLLMANHSPHACSKVFYWLQAVNNI